MTHDSATNFQCAIAECRRLLVLNDRHRFALPHEPRPGYRSRRARAQNVALLAAVAVLAVVYCAI
jgi:hypothetical protein